MVSLVGCVCFWSVAGIFCGFDGIVFAMHGGGICVRCN